VGEKVEFEAVAQDLVGDFANAALRRGAGVEERVRA